jgi:hypothetical protein
MDTCADRRPREAREPRSCQRPRCSEPKRDALHDVIGIMFRFGCRDGYLVTVSRNYAAIVAR